MSNVGNASGIRWGAGLVLAVALLLCWATLASAQTPNDAQYDDPSASGTAAIESSGGGADPTGADPTASGSSASGVEGILPATGGPLLAFVGLSAVALGSATMLVVRLNKSNRRS